MGKSGMLQVHGNHSKIMVGIVLSIVSQTTDITERKRLDSKLRESEERYRSVFENSIDAILLTTPDGGMLAANPAACRMFGRTEEELLKVGRDGIVDPSDPRLRDPHGGEGARGQIHRRTRFQA